MGEIVTLDTRAWASSSPGPLVFFLSAGNVTKRNGGSGNENGAWGAWAVCVRMRADLLVNVLSLSIQRHYNPVEFFLQRFLIC